MSGEQELDRNEAASPYKLAEARKRGQVVKSADLVSALVMSAAAVTFHAKGWDTLVRFFKFEGQILALATESARSAQAPWLLWDMITLAVRGSLGLLLPLLATVMIAALLANIGQTGALWSWHPLQPDWQRLNPATGFRRVWSMRSLFDTARALLKLLVLSLTVFFALRSMTPHFQQLAGVTPYGHAGMLVRDMASLSLKIALAMGLIALIDLAFTHREYARNMRMSRRELRDESKHREGDPRIRSRLRELRREMLKRSLALKRTAQADVVVTNPTHIAVALSYRHGRMEAPVLVCKGAGGMAAAMRVIAARHRIPVLRSPALARALHAQTALDSQIPPDLYSDVARLMVWIQSMRMISRQGRAGAPT